MPRKTTYKKIEKIAVRMSWEDAEKLRGEARRTGNTISDVIRGKLAASDVNGGGK